MDIVQRPSLVVVDFDYWGKLPLFSGWAVRNCAIFPFPEYDLEMT